MGFIEVFGLALGLIAFGTVMALFWRVLNKIFRAIEHHHDDDKHLEDEEAVRRYGIREIETTALGCTSRGQASSRHN